jgi:DNA-binding XRE family transcriptional regulator
MLTNYCSIRGVGILTALIQLFCSGHLDRSLLPDQGATPLAGRTRSLPGSGQAENLFGCLDRIDVDLRTEAGLSQRELAERAGCNVFTVNKLERGVQEPAWPLVLALANPLCAPSLAVPLHLGVFISGR